MSEQKKVTNPETSEPLKEEVRFQVEPGTKVQITIEVGEKLDTGKVPLTVHIEQAADESVPVEEIVIAPVLQPVPKPVRAPVIKAEKLRAGLAALQSRLKTYDIATWLFILAIGLYLLTRLIGLDRFPIYFFTDEAIQTQSIIDLINHKYRDSAGLLFPTYFRNGEYYNLSTSVYLQWLPYLLFGRSAVVTRITSVLVTVIAAIVLGLILRDVFKIKYWWAGTLFLSITPAWFLHSRTAFETVEFVAFYAGMLCTYLFYVYKSPRYIYLTIVLGALAFYTYSPAQVIVPLTALGLLISDWRYHWENRSLLLRGALLALVLVIPYVRSSLNNPNAPLTHLHTLWSYWFENIPLSEKIARYFTEFGYALSPAYWYIPNERDLARHLMKDYGHILLATLPFTLLGMVYILRTLRLPASRAVLIVFLISPAAAALVQASITRVLVFVIPVAIMTAIGLDQVLRWIEEPKKHLAELDQGPGLTPRRAVTATLILIVGFLLAFRAKENINFFTLLILTILLALQVSGLLEKLARLVRWQEYKLWSLPHVLMALVAFILLAWTNVRMFNDALTNGPLWYGDYGMGGLQYGAFQVFDIVEEYVREHPDAHIIFSPDWANGTDIVARFFMGDPMPMQMGSVRGHITQKLPLDDNTLFIITPQEYDLITHSEKLTDIQVERILPYPDGNPGFYFVHLRYVDNIDEIFAAEKAVRQVMQESTLTIDGQPVKIRHTYLDADFQDQAIALVFDNDPYTVSKTYENNPFVIEMIFPEVRELTGFSIIIGSAKVQITLKCYSAPEAQPVVYTFEGQGTPREPELSFDLPASTSAQILQVEVFDPTAVEPAKVHIWEIKLR